MRNDFSVVVPCYNEQDCVEQFHFRITAACKSAAVSSYEIIYVNDGSTDNSLQILLALHRVDSHVRIIDFSRNHGHQIALTAGLFPFPR